MAEFGIKASNVTELTSPVTVRKGVQTDVSGLNVIAHAMGSLFSGSGSNKKKQAPGVYDLETGLSKIQSGLDQGKYSKSAAMIKSRELFSNINSANPNSTSQLLGTFKKSEGVALNAPTPVQKSATSAYTSDLEKGLNAGKKGDRDNIVKEVREEAYTKELIDAKTKEAKLLLTKDKVRKTELARVKEVQLSGIRIGLRSAVPQVLDRAALIEKKMQEDPNFTGVDATKEFENWFSQTISSIRGDALAAGLPKKDIDAVYEYVAAVRDVKIKFWNNKLKAEEAKNQLSMIQDKSTLKILSYGDNATYAATLKMTKGTPVGVSIGHKLIKNVTDMVNKEGSSPDKPESVNTKSPERGVSSVLKRMSKFSQQSPTKLGGTDNPVYKDREGSPPLPSVTEHKSVVMLKAINKHTKEIWETLKTNKGIDADDKVKLETGLNSIMNGQLLSLVQQANVTTDPKKWKALVSNITSVHFGEWLDKNKDALKNNEVFNKAGDVAIKVWGNKALPLIIKGKEAITKSIGIEGAVKVIWDGSPKLVPDMDNPEVAKLYKNKFDRDRAGGKDILTSSPLFKMKLKPDDGTETKVSNLNRLIDDFNQNVSPVLHNVVKLTSHIKSGTPLDYKGEWERVYKDNINGKKSEPLDRVLERVNTPTTNPHPPKSDVRVEPKSGVKVEPKISKPEQTLIDGKKVENSPTPKKAVEAVKVKPNTPTPVKPKKAAVGVFMDIKPIKGTTRPVATIKPFYSQKGMQLLDPSTWDFSKGKSLNTHINVDGKERVITVNAASYPSNKKVVFKPSITNSKGNGKYVKFLSRVGGVESGPAGYNSVCGNKVKVNVVNMSVNEAIQFSKTEWKGKKANVLGAYQFKDDTLVYLKTALNLTGNEKMTVQLQDKMAIALLNRRGLQEYLSGKITKDKLMDELAKEWASLPLKNGKSFHSKNGINKALISREELSQLVDSLTQEQKPNTNTSEKFQVNGLDIKYIGDNNITYGKSATAYAKPFKYLVVHHTQNKNLKNMANYGKSYDKGRGGMFGYHFYIGRDGKVIQGAPLTKRTNHVKGPNKSARKGTAKGLSNSNAVSISLVGAHRGATEAQKIAAKKLGKALMKEFSINNKSVFGHGDLQTDRMHSEGQDVVKLLRG